MQGHKISDPRNTQGHATTIHKGIPEWGNQQCSGEWEHLLAKCTAVLADYSHVTGTISILTYLLTPSCRVLLEKLTGLQLVKKFPAFYGT